MTATTEKGLWCSWCCMQVDMVLLQRNMLSRNLYRCSNCANETNHCTICKLGMSKMQSTGPEALCASCDRTIKKWGDKPNITVKSYCSWCFVESNHQRQQQNYMSRDIYECENCHKTTMKCRMCNDKLESGMTRGEDMLCFKCCRKIKDWKNPEESI